MLTKKFFFNLGKKKENHIKKPLNAFMLYMKEMRSVVQAECTLKESAAINQILGKRVRFFYNSTLKKFLFTVGRKSLKKTTNFSPPMFSYKKSF